MIQIAIEKSKTLVEALPYIKKFRGHTVVIKYGGSLMSNDRLKEIFAKDVTLLKYVGLNPVIVHGGGQEISAWMKKLNKEPVFINGLRYTDTETMEVTEMVLTGKINREVVSLINRSGGKAVGLSGRDANLFTARQIRGKNDEDLGFVGEVETCDTTVINALTEKGYIPVISSVSESLDGEPLNVNADYAAASVAVSLKALKLIYLTDVQGLMIDGKLVSDLDLNQANKLLDHPDVQGGMLPKLQCCIKAIMGDVRHVHMLDGGMEHSILLEVFTDVGIGTRVTYSTRK
jgi:acetylglutamate kinase